MTILIQKRFDLYQLRRKSIDTKWRGKMSDISAGNGNLSDY